MHDGPLAQQNLLKSGRQFQRKVFTCHEWRFVKRNWQTSAVSEKRTLQKMKEQMDA